MIALEANLVLEEISRFRNRN